MSLRPGFGVCFLGATLGCLPPPPRCVSVVGSPACRTAFARPRASVGPQDEALGGVRVWVLPNPSGLNAHWSAESLAGEFARLRGAAGMPSHKNRPLTIRDGI